MYFINEIFYNMILMKFDIIWLLCVLLLNIYAKYMSTQAVVTIYVVRRQLGQYSI